MYQDVLAHSPLLVLPLVAMFIFMAVWVVSAVRVMTRSRTEMEQAARLPLEDDQ
jgi:cbb3-type cytochrome oxidase subunit 3